MSTMTPRTYWVGPRGLDPVDFRSAIADAGPEGVITVWRRDDGLLIGPTARPGHRGCAACLPQAVGAVTSAPEWMLEMARVQIETRLDAREFVTIGADGQVRGHRVAVNPECSVCATPATSVTVDRAANGSSPLRRPLSEAVRAGDSAVGSGRYTTVRRTLRLADAGVAATATELGGGIRTAGSGRGRDLRTADALAVMEALERTGSIPSADLPVLHATVSAVGADAVPLGDFGRYTERQLRASDTLRPIDATTPLDWVAARDAFAGTLRLVPAEFGFPWYRYRDPDSGASYCHFAESTSGTSLGSSFEEATVHGLLELIERDAVLVAWHAAAALDRIVPDSLADEEVELLRHVIARNGYDVYLLDATSDLGIPVVVAVARNLGGDPAAFLTAGSSYDIADAARSALWELSQQVTCPASIDPVARRALIADPWQVLTIRHHWMRYTAPSAAPRLLRLIGRKEIAAPDTRGYENRSTAMDLAEATARLKAALTAAGLHTVLAVDQSTLVQQAVGLSTVRTIVPGMASLSFGQAHQRFLGISRLGVAATHPDTLDPHPFP